MRRQQPSGRQQHLADPERGERGAATVEFGLLLPLLVMVVVGIMAVAGGWNAKLALNQGTRAGARIYAIGGTAAEAKAAVEDAASELEPSRLTVVVPEGPCTVGEPVTVRSSYRYTFSVPLLPSRDITITSKGVLPCGG